MSSNTESRVTIIAEAGTAHLGDLERAKRLIDAAAAAGADSIKFQWVIADEIVHPNAGSIILHSRPVHIWERFKSLERPFEFYADLKRETEQRGLDFLCSPFGLASASGLQMLGVEAIKIASPELNHYPLLAALSDLPMILSTGVSKLGDIERSLEFIRTNAEPRKELSALPSLSLLHCISAYPAPEEEYNLEVLPLLGKLFGTRVGLSDHSLHPSLVPVLAVSRGAQIIEKHITLAHSDSGLDDPIALEPHNFAAMVQRVRAAEQKDPGQIEFEMRSEYGNTRVRRVLGNGTKKLAASEAAFYATTNRSIVAVVDLQAGERLQEHSFALLRSEQQRTPGLPPHFSDRILGAHLKKSVPAGTGITWADLL
jgi:sialic acid synthase SpsE